MHYNSKITVTAIPLEAYEYVVNGKPALDWVVERQCVKVDGDSEIVNDANDWANDTLDDPKFRLSYSCGLSRLAWKRWKLFAGCSLSCWPTATRKQNWKCRNLRHDEYVQIIGANSGRRATPSG